MSYLTDKHMNYLIKYKDNKNIGKGLVGYYGNNIQWGCKSKTCATACSGGKENYYRLND